MTTDDRLTRYLSDQAESIALAPADATAVMRRGARRRARRRAGFVGGLAVAGVLATTLAVRDPGTDRPLDLAVAPSATASSYDWSTVVPRSGLAYGGDSAQLADGSIYGISTAPGPYDPDDADRSQTPTLYRSQDGTEWRPVSLPAGVRGADLAGAGDTLFSLGTAPAGGLVLSASTDGATSWSSVELGDDLAQLEARHGDRIQIGSVDVAAMDATHLVAAVTVSTSQDLSVFRPEFTYESHEWRWDAEGVEVFELPAPECKDASGAAAPGVTREGDAAAADALGCRTVRPDGGPAGEPVASFTYEELGIVGELRDHVGGRAYAYASDDGQAFERVDLPVASEPGRTLGPAEAEATADGYRLAVGSFGAAPGDTTVLRSADGRTWEATATIPGSFNGLGLVAGRPALAVWSEDGTATVQIEQGDGVWSAIDVAGAVVAPEGSRTWLEQVAFGPLGLAAVVTSATEDGEGPIVQHVVHSTDGGLLEVLPVADLTEVRGMVSGVVVTADAVFARITESAADDDPATIPTQTVLVGTPTS